MSVVPCPSALKCVMLGNVHASCNAASTLYIIKMCSGNYFTYVPRPPCMLAVLQYFSTWITQHVVGYAHILTQQNGIFACIPNYLKSKASFLLKLWQLQIVDWRVTVIIIAIQFWAVITSTEIKLGMQVTLGSIWCESYGLSVDHNNLAIDEYHGLLTGRHQPPELWLIGLFDQHHNWILLN